MDDDELDVELLMHDFRRLIDSEQLPAGRTFIRFTCPALKEFAHWWIVIEESGHRKLCIDNPDKEVEFSFRCNLPTTIEIWAGDTSIAVAKKAELLQVSSNPIHVRTASQWLRLGQLARIRPKRYGQYMVGA